MGVLKLYSKVYLQEWLSLVSNLSKMHIDLFDLCISGSNSSTDRQNQGKEIKHSTEINYFQRLLSDQPQQPNSKVNWSISGYCNNLDQNFISVSVSASVQVICQRCMGTMDLDIKSDNQFIIFKTQNEVQAYDVSATEDDLEPLLVTSKNFDVLELIEDELILNMPFTPKHNDCVYDAPEDADISLNGGLADRPSPFAILSKLKKN